MPQAPGQDPALNAQDILQQYQQLQGTGMLPQAAQQQAPAQMDPSMVVDSLMKAGQMQTLGTRLGTYRPTVWAQQRGIQGPAPVNLLQGPTQNALAPLMQGQLQTQNQNQLINFANTQAQAQTDARNLGVSGATGMVGAQRTGQLQKEVAKIQADALMQRLFMPNQRDAAATSQADRIDQAAARAQDIVRQVPNMPLLYRAAAPAGYLDKLTGGASSGLFSNLMNKIGLGDQAPATQPERDQFGNLSSEWIRVMGLLAGEYPRFEAQSGGRVLPRELHERLGSTQLPKGWESPEAALADLQVIRDNARGLRANIDAVRGGNITRLMGSGRGQIAQPSDFNRGLGATNEDPSQATTDPDYSGNQLSGDTTVPQAGDKGQNVDPSRGGLNATERARMIQLRAKRGSRR